MIRQGQSCDVYKVCQTCGEMKWRSKDFHRKQSKKLIGTKFDSRCKDCVNAYRRMRTKATPKLIEMHGKHCTYCHRKEYLNAVYKVSPIRGGTDTLDNMLLACKTCATDRGNMSDREYRDYRYKRLLYYTYSTKTLFPIEFFRKRDLDGWEVPN